MRKLPVVFVTKGEILAATAVAVIVSAGVISSRPALATESHTAADDTAGDRVNAELEVQLESARKQLEQAAREVAELSTRLGRPVMERFMSHGEGAPRAVLGVQLDTDSGKDGARIQEVSPGGPAADAGLKTGDVIVAINGADVRGAEPAREVLHEMRDVAPESKVKIRVLRSGKPHDFLVTARPGVGFIGTRELPGL